MIVTNLTGIRPQIHDFRFEAPIILKSNRILKIFTPEQSRQLRSAKEQVKEKLYYGPGTIKKRIQEDSA